MGPKGFARASKPMSAFFGAGEALSEMLFECEMKLSAQKVIISLQNVTTPLSEVPVPKLFAHSIEKYAEHICTPLERSIIQHFPWCSMVYFEDLQGCSKATTHSKIAAIQPLLDQWN